MWKCFKLLWALTLLTHDEVSARSGTEDLRIDEQIDNLEEQIGGEISNEDNNNNEDEDENEWPSDWYNIT